MTARSNLNSMVAPVLVAGGLPGGEYPRSRGDRRTSSAVVSVADFIRSDDEEPRRLLQNVMVMAECAVKRVRSLGEATPVVLTT